MDRNIFARGHMFPRSLRITLSKADKPKDKGFLAWFRANQVLVSAGASIVVAYMAVYSGV
jgi:hypothetical protein